MALTYGELANLYKTVVVSRNAFGTIAASTTKGGSDEHRRRITPPESRPIGIAPSPETARRFTGYPIETTTHPSERARESSRVAPDFISPFKGYRLWKAHIQLVNKPVVRRIGPLPYLNALHPDYPLDITQWPVEHETSYLSRLWQQGEGFVPPDAITELQSLATEPPLGLWSAREPKVAECILCGFHSAAHSCGIYAMQSPESIIHDIYLCGISIVKSSVSAERFDLTAIIGGAVWLWGDVAEHETGYRAQYGYPAEFYYTMAASQQETVVKHIASVFGVPATVYSGPRYL